MEKIQNTAVKAQTNEHAAAKAEKDDAEFKAKKAEAAKRFKEKQKAEKEQITAMAKEIIDALAKAKVNLKPEHAALLSKLANPTAQHSGGGQNVFNKIFGDNPKVGDKITVLQYMQKTFKAKAELDKRVKEWAAKGIVVEYKENPANLADSTYTIVKLA